MEENHLDIPIMAELGEPGTPYVEEVEIPKRKRLDVIHGADPNRPADRNRKYSLPGRKSRATRKTLCERLCGIIVKFSSMNSETAVLPNLDPVPLLRYNEFRALTSDASSQFYNDNSRSGAKDPPEFMNLELTNVLIKKS